MDGKIKEIRSVLICRMTRGLLWLVVRESLAKRLTFKLRLNPKKRESKDPKGE